jgi:small subunit ribosomal protein S5
MSDTETPIDEPPQDIAPGLALAWAQTEIDYDDEKTQRRRRGPDPIKALREWTPSTRLGRMVYNGQIISFEAALASGMRIREVEIVDALLPGLESDVINVNMIQRMTDSGRRVRFNVMVCVGNMDGIVGLGICKGKEVASTIQKATIKAKLNLILVQRGNGSWESGGGPGTSVPIRVTGQSGSTRVTLIPAPGGKGLVIGETGRNVLTFAGITDVWSRSQGQTRTTINFAKATYNALTALNMTRINPAERERLHINTGRML